MDYLLAKKLLAEEILDFDKLILKNYKTIGMSEFEAIVVIELNNQMKKGSTFLSPAKLGKNLSMSQEELLTILDKLLKKNLLTIQLKKGKNGKETEVFLLDNIIERIFVNYQNKLKDELINKPKQYESNAEEIVDLIETHFQKQLKPLEVELIQKWLDEDKFDCLEIKKALLDAVKANKFNLSYVDSVLSKRRLRDKKATDVRYEVENSELLKGIFDSWDDSKK
ncbi:MAG: DnaD domain protein [Candidatus Izemoplasmatales bacterium]|jgi:DNA replication protein|nr:DnaD domain protein [Candidatus Izemoplasmatales bacterium]